MCLCRSPHQAQTSRIVSNPGFEPGGSQVSLTNREMRRTVKVTHVSDELSRDIYHTTYHRKSQTVGNIREQETTKLLKRKSERICGCPHNPKVGGSNPSPAIDDSASYKKKGGLKAAFFNDCAGSHLPSA